jgi:hypothetical protein
MPRVRLRSTIYPTVTTVLNVTDKHPNIRVDWVTTPVFERWHLLWNQDAKIHPDRR